MIRIFTSFVTIILQNLQKLKLKVFFQKQTKTAYKKIILSYIAINIKTSDKMKNPRLTLVLISLFLLFFKLINAQNNEIKTALEISKGTKIKYVKAGKKISIWYEGEKYKVWVDSIGQNEIFTKNKVFEINKADKISVRFRATMISGSIIGTGGLLFTGLGTALIIKGISSNDLGGVFVAIIGIAVDIIAVPVTVIGTSVFFVGKKYKKSKGWRFKAVQIE